MVLTLVTNASFDTPAGLVPAPYGPLTRVTNIDTTVDYDFNSDVAIECTSALSATVYISFDEMADVAIRDEILAKAHGGRNLNHVAYMAALATEVIHEHIKSYSGPPFLDTEWQTIIGGFRYMQFLAAQVPISSYDEVESGNRVNISTLTFVDSVTANEADLTMVVDGSWTMGMIEWEAGVVTVITPADAVALAAGLAHDYGGTGAQTARIIVIGPGGFQTQSVDVTVA